MPYISQGSVGIVNVNVNRKMFNLAKITYAIAQTRKCSTGVYRITSGNECWNRNVFRSLRKAETDGADWMSSGREFQNIEAATGNEDGRLLTDGMTGRAAAVWKTIVDGDDQ